MIFQHAFDYTPVGSNDNIRNPYASFAPIFNMIKSCLVYRLGIFFPLKGCVLVIVALSLQNLTHKFKLRYKVTFKYFVLLNPLKLNMFCWSE